MYKKCSRNLSFYKEKQGQADTGLCRIPKIGSGFRYKMSKRTKNTIIC